MNTKTKKKLCWNCEGEVAVDAPSCPYCGVSLEVPAMLQTENRDLLNPPYRLGANGAHNQIPNAPYKQAESLPEEPKSDLKKEEAKESIAHDPRSIVLSLILMLLGSTFAVFGMVLWLFSNPKGHLTLSWNGDYWFIYLLLSIPMLFIGWKATQTKE